MRAIWEIEVMHIDRMAVLAALCLTLSSTGWSADSLTGQEAYNSGDYQTALTEWQPLAEEGFADAQFGMGLLYANGFGVSIDDDLALNWYQLAADQGHAEAQCSLAVMYSNGWGVTQSDEEAFKWYRLAAEAGLTQAQTSLAKMYAKGRGTGKDVVEAHRWYSIASGLGDSGAAFKRDSLAAKMSPVELSESDRLTSIWIDSHQNLLAHQ
jgi:TPR repeat protein